MSAERLTAALADRYRLDRELGAGGMATVYLAEDRKHKRQVAIKVLKPELAAVLGAERFVQEITTTAALQHPHILPLFDSGEADGFLYYVMPFIDGETLRAKLDRETQLGVDEAVKITTDVADALHYAHSQGIVHRDIKPENILLQNGRPMVADFGIALAVSAAAGGRMTETGLSLGTPHYMSPEQATAEKDISARSDQYSLASVLYEMLTGNPPHTGASAQQIIMKIITEAPADVTAFRKSVPEHVAAATAKALEKLPADRFASTRAFAEALGNPAFTLPGRGGSGATASGTRQGLLVPALALIAAATTALAAWSWLRPTPALSRGAGWKVAIQLPDSTPLGDAIALSRDGTTLVYDGNDQLWVRTAKDIAPYPLPGGEGAGFSAISPDGTQIAFYHRPTGQIRIVPIGGGASRTVGASLYDAPLSWLDDANLLAVAIEGVRVLPINGGASRLLTTVNPAANEQYHYGAVPLDGTGKVAFIVAALDGDSLRVGVSGPDSTAHTILMTGLRVQFARPGHLIVTRADGTIVAVPIDVSAGRLTGPPVRLVGGLAVGILLSSGSVEVSDAGRLVYVASTGWYEPPSELISLDRRGVATVYDSTLVGQWKGVAVEPAGARIALVQETAEGVDLLVRNRNNGSQVRLSVPGVQMFDPAFTADGRGLLFTGLGRTPKVYRVRANASMKLDEIMTAPPLSMVRSPTMASDSGPVYLTVQGTNGPRVVAVSPPAMAFDTLATPGADSAASPRLSPDGKWLAYTSYSSEGSSIHVRSVDPQRSDDWTVSSRRRAGAQTRWSPSGTELFYVANDSMIAARVSTEESFRVLDRQALFSVTGLSSYFDVTGDGQFLMFRPRPDRRPPTTLVMVEHWTDLLPR